MPVLLSPKSKFEVSLDGDSELDPKPMFALRALSAEAFSETIKFLQSIETAEKNVETINAIVEKAESLIVGWRNMIGEDGEIPYSPGMACKILTVPECMELIGKAVKGGTVSEDERKKSE